MRNITINAFDMELTEAIDSYIREKMNALDKYIDPKDESVSCSVRVSKTTQHHKSGDFYKAEVSIHTSTKDFGATEEKDDLYASIDEMKDRVARKMADYKDKKENIFRRSSLKLKNILRGLNE